MFTVGAIETECPQNFNFYIFYLVIFFKPSLYYVIEITKLIKGRIIAWRQLKYFKLSYLATWCKTPPFPAPVAALLEINCRDAIHEIWTAPLLHLCHSPITTVSLWSVWSLSTAVNITVTRNVTYPLISDGFRTGENIT